MTTRDKILNEALTLFAENGYDGTSVEEIAEKVGIKAPSRKHVMRNSSALTDISASFQRAKRNLYKQQYKEFLLP